MRICISSTKGDLDEFRISAMAILAQLGTDIEAMELDHATPDSHLRYSLKLVDSADLFICIVAYHYGSTPRPEQLSYTEAEIRRAIENKTPILAFLCESMDSWPQEWIDDDQTRIGVCSGYVCMLSLTCTRTC